MENAKPAEQLKVSLAQNKALTSLFSKKICGVAATHSENHKANKCQQTENTRGCKNLSITEEKMWYPLGYFWTHGHKVDVGHKIWMLRTHRFNINIKKTVMRDDMMGVRKRGKDWTLD